MKQRLDLILVQRGLTRSREAAQALVMSGRVEVEGRRVDKPGQRVDTECELQVFGRDPYVGRGGVKLAGALDAFGLQVTGLTALDIGASTGGFTDCLLQRGAAAVFAVDVGHGQLDWGLRNDSRVRVFEGVNARFLQPETLPGLEDGADMAVVDVSFISLRLILPRIPALLRATPQGITAGDPRSAAGSILALVKPQFEVGRGQVGRGGIVLDPGLRREAILKTAGLAAELSLSVMGLSSSCITGAEGNQEYFIHLSGRRGGLTPEEISENAARITTPESRQD